MFNIIVEPVPRNPRSKGIFVSWFWRRLPTQGVSRLDNIKVNCLCT